MSGLWGGPLNDPSPSPPNLLRRRGITRVQSHGVDNAAPASPEGSMDSLTPESAAGDSCGFTSPFTFPHLTPGGSASSNRSSSSPVFMPAHSQDQNNNSNVMEGVGDLAVAMERAAALFGTATGMPGMLCQGITGGESGRESNKMFSTTPTSDTGSYNADSKSERGGASLPSDGSPEELSLGGVASVNGAQHDSHLPTDTSTIEAGLLMPSSPLAEGPPLSTTVHPSAPFTLSGAAAAAATAAAAAVAAATVFMWREFTGSHAHPSSPAGAAAAMPDDKAGEADRSSAASAYHPALPSPFRRSGAPISTMRL
jgi:hypothetical protein